MNGLPPALDNRIGYRKVLTDIGSQPNLFFKNFCLDKGVHFSGSKEFISSIYLFDIENHVILHPYDDRGLDIVAYDKDTLIPIYKELNKWILDYDRKQIDKIFVI